MVGSCECGNEPSVCIKWVEGISWVTEELLAAQEGLCSVHTVNVSVTSWPETLCCEEYCRSSPLWPQIRDRTWTCHTTVTAVQDINITRLWQDVLRRTTIKILTCAVNTVWTTPQNFAFHRRYLGLFFYFFYWNGPNIFFSPVTFFVTRWPHKAPNIYDASVSPPHKCHGRHIGIFMVELAAVIQYCHDWHAVSGLTNIGPYYLTFVTECKGGKLLHMHFVSWVTRLERSKRSVRKHVCRCLLVTCCINSAYIWCMFVRAS